MFFPTEDRVETVRQIFRQYEEEGVEPHLEQLLEALQDHMARKTAWKAIQSLVDIGAIECIESMGERGHVRRKYRLGEWDLMTEEQRKEVIDLLRDVRDNTATRMVVNVTIQNVERLVMTPQAEETHGDSPGNP